MRMAPGQGAQTGTGPGAGGYGWGGGYGPGAGPQSGGNGGIGSGTGVSYDDDPFYGSGITKWVFTPASERFQKDHKYSSIDPNFFYGRRDWQETQRAPEYIAWKKRARQEFLMRQLFQRLGLPVDSYKPFSRMAGGAPKVDTLWDDVRRTLQSPGPMKPYWTGFGQSPAMSDRPNYW